MGLLSRSHNIFRTVNALQKASPIVVHLLMIFGVAIYALIGALVMQKLESKVVQRSRRSVEIVGGNFRVNDTRNVSTLLEQQISDQTTKNQSFPTVNGTGGSKAVARRTSKREIAQFVRGRKCVMRALKTLIDYDCDERILDRLTIRMIEDCYTATIRGERSIDSVAFKSTSGGVELANKQAEYIEQWSFSDSILFAFTIITTIGYGNIAPQTFGGRLFCIGYAFFGIPFTLLAIADLGKFFSEIIDSWGQHLQRMLKKIKRKYRRIYLRDMALSMTSINFSTRDLTKMENGDFKGNQTDTQKLNEDGQTGNEKPANKEEDEEELEPLSHTLPLVCCFILYSLLGALLLSMYEPEMDFFKAVYFNFITLTSIGLGDVVPKSDAFMGLTLLYIAIGLALTTIAIDIAADYLKRIHYFGRKIENAGQVLIWFGGKTLTVKQLVRNLGDQFNLPVTTVKHLDIDKFVDDAIKVEEGELETLRPPPVDISESPINFADDDDAEEDEPWLPMPTPSPTPTPSPSPPPPVEPEREPTPTPSPSPPPPEPEPEEEPGREPTPPPPPKERPRELTQEELAALKRKAYSEEAWRRYQEYQKQWRRFRQTQQQYPGPSGGRRRSSAASSRRSGSQQGNLVGQTSIDRSADSGEPPKQNQ